MKLNKRYGRLTVVGKPIRKGNNYRVLVRCDCGQETYAWVHNMKSGATTSCGCVKVELAAQRMKQRSDERAREMVQRVKEERRVKKLKRAATEIAKSVWKSRTIRTITDPVREQIDAISKEIKKEAWHKAGGLDLWDLRLQREEISLKEYHQHVEPILEEQRRFDEMVADKRNRVTRRWEKLFDRAILKGKKAIVRAGLPSEALFSRVVARSILVALRKLNPDRGGEIPQRLFGPIQAIQQPLQRWLAANRRERPERPPRGSAGIVLEPAPVSEGSPVAAG